MNARRKRSSIMKGKGEMEEEEEEEK